MGNPYTHIHVTHLILCRRIFKYTILEIVYDGKGRPKQNTYPFFGIVSQLNEFHTIPSQTLTTNNLNDIFLGNAPHFFQKNE